MLKSKNTNIKLEQILKHKNQFLRWKTALIMEKETFSQDENTPIFTPVLRLCWWWWFIIMSSSTIFNVHLEKKSLIFNFSIFGRTYRSLTPLYTHIPAIINSQIRQHSSCTTDGSDFGAQSLARVCVISDVLVRHERHHNQIYTHKPYPIFDWQKLKIYV